MGSFTRDSPSIARYSYYELSDLDEQDNTQVPTDEERETLRRVADAVPWNAFRKSSSSCPCVVLRCCFIVIAFVELAERFSFYGTTVVLVSHRRVVPGSSTH